MIEYANEVLEGTGWEALDECTLACECGDTIEWDGECSECGPSPLRTMGLI